MLQERLLSKFISILINLLIKFINIAVNQVNLEVYYLIIIKSFVISHGFRRRALFYGKLANNF